MIWLNFSDEIKMQNTLGINWTSKNSFQWNYGTLSQRLDIGEIKKIFWSRVIFLNASGNLGLTLIGVSLFIAKKRIRAFLLLSLVLFFLPILIFFNLHSVHDYYQVASTLFLIAALSISISEVLPNQFDKFRFTPVITLLLVLNNLTSFNNAGYSNTMKETFNKSNSDILAASDIIKRHTNENSGIIIFGAPFGSGELGYYSERKSCSFPYQPGNKSFDLMWNKPSMYLGNLKLGAIVFIGINLQIISAQSNVKVSSGLFKVSENCYVWIPRNESLLTHDRRKLSPIVLLPK
jgi:hypothetical protein